MSKEYHITYIKDGKFGELFRFTLADAKHEVVCLMDEGATKVQVNTFQVESLTIDYVRSKEAIK